MEIRDVICQKLIDTEDQLVYEISFIIPEDSYSCHHSIYIKGYSTYVFTMFDFVLSGNNMMGWLHTVQNFIRNHKHSDVDCHLINCSDKDITEDDTHNLRMILQCIVSFDPSKHEFLSCTDDPKIHGYYRYKDAKMFRYHTSTIVDGKPNPLHPPKIKFGDIYSGEIIQRAFIDDSTYQGGY